MSGFFSKPLNYLHGKFVRCLTRKRPHIVYTQLSVFPRAIPSAGMLFLARVSMPPSFFSKRFIPPTPLFVEPALADQTEYMSFLSGLSNASLSYALLGQHIYPLLNSELFQWKVRFFTNSQHTECLSQSQCLIITFYLQLNFFEELLLYSINFKCTK